jgi:hypothetical protein
MNIHDLEAFEDLSDTRRTSLYVNDADHGGHYVGQLGTIDCDRPRTCSGSHWKRTLVVRAESRPQLILIHMQG